MKVYCVFYRNGEEIILRHVFKAEYKAKEYVEIMNRESKYEFWVETEVVVE